MLTRVFIFGMTAAILALSIAPPASFADAQSDYAPDGPYSFGGPYRDCGWGFGGCGSAYDHNGPRHGFYNAGDDYPYFHYPYHRHYRHGHSRYR